jgi:hypothetical protein
MYTNIPSHSFNVPHFRTSCVSAYVDPLHCLKQPMHLLVHELSKHKLHRHQVKFHPINKVVHIVKWCWKSCCACCKDDGNHQERTWSQWPCMWLPLHLSTTMWRSSTNLGALNTSPITSFHLESSSVIHARDCLSTSSYLVESFRAFTV